MKVTVKVDANSAVEQKGFRPMQGDLCVYQGYVCIRTGIPLGTEGALVSQELGATWAGDGGPISPFYGTVTLTSEAGNA